MLEIAVAAFAVGGGIFSSAGDSNEHKQRQELREYTRRAKAEAAAKTLRAAQDAESRIEACGRTIGAARAVVDAVFDEFVNGAGK